MAAATIAAGYPKRVVSGNVQKWIYKVSADTTNTIATPLHKILHVSFGPTAAATTPACTISGGTLTLLLGASDSALLVEVTGV